MRNGYRFTMYGPGYAYIFQELAEKGPVLPDDSYQLMVIEKSKDKRSIMPGNTSKHRFNMCQLYAMGT